MATIMELAATRKVYRTTAPAYLLRRFPVEVYCYYREYDIWYPYHKRGRNPGAVLGELLPEPGKHDIREA